MDQGVIEKLNRVYKNKYFVSFASVWKQKSL